MLISNSVLILVLILVLMMMIAMMMEFVWLVDAFVFPALQVPEHILIN